MPFRPTVFHQSRLNNSIRTTYRWNYADSAINIGKMKSKPQKKKDREKKRGFWNASPIIGGIVLIPRIMSILLGKDIKLKVNVPR